MIEKFQGKIVCVIPAFNESENIYKTIKEVRPYVDEIVVVDDGSSDNTVAIAKHGNVIVLRHILNRGQGSALATGNLYALMVGADIIIHFDADGQFLASEIEDMIKPIINKEAEIVFGSRFLGKQSNIPSFKKYIILPLARIFNYLFFKVKLTDPQSGFRALSRVATQKIKIKNDGSAHCSEILSKALRYKLKIKEIPITVVYKDFGQNIFGGKGRGMGATRIIKDLILSKLLD